MGGKLGTQLVAGAILGGTKAIGPIKMRKELVHDYIVKTISPHI